MGDNTHECTVGGNAYAVMWEGKDDDNGGLIYGIEYMDGEEVSDVEWPRCIKVARNILAPPANNPSDCQTNRKSVDTNAMNVQTKKRERISNVSIRQGLECCKK